jgi:hypothetical protein
VNACHVEWTVMAVQSEYVYLHQLAQNTDPRSAVDSSCLRPRPPDSSSQIPSESSSISLSSIIPETLSLWSLYSARASPVSQGSHYSIFDVFRKFSAMTHCSLESGICSFLVWSTAVTLFHPRFTYWLISSDLVPVLVLFWSHAAKPV